MRDAGKLRRLALLLAAAAVAATGHAQPESAAQPLPGITASGQPDESALEGLAEKGYAAVIDLRTPEEDRGLNEQRTVEDLGMTYVSLPIAGPDDVNYENASALNAILRETQRPILIHCSTGNRVGALLSLRQRLIGADAEEALATGVEAGMTRPVLRETVEALLVEPREP